MTKLAPSLLAASPLNLEEGIKNINEFADILHLDIMDGHFVPNLALGILTCESACKASLVPVYAHLMVSNPDEYIEKFRNMGAKVFVWHVELDLKHMEIINLVKSSGMKPGLAIKPDTDCNILKPFIDQIGIVTVMGVYPGFSGQKFIPSTTNRVAKVRELSEIIEIEVDGGVGLENAPALVENGADILVSGSSFFNSKDKKAFSDQIRSLRRKP
jgi:ribulose-phosphate 3-epimerase